MKIHTEILKLKTRKEIEFINITNKIEQIVDKTKIKEGFVNVFSKHTTLAIKINEDEHLLLKDINWLMKKLVPDKRDYFHDKIHLRKNCPKDEPKNGKGHLKSLLMENSQVIPIQKFKMQLGQYQQIFAIETSDPRERKIIIQVIGEQN